jgi:hypothetical protein
MTADDVRAKVAAGDYDGAAACFVEYARGLPLTADALAEFDELLRWTRTTVLCARSRREAALLSAREEAHVAAAYRA